MFKKNKITEVTVFIGNKYSYYEVGTKLLAKKDVPMEVHTTKIEVDKKKQIVKIYFSDGKFMLYNKLPFSIISSP